MTDDAPWLEYRQTQPAAPASDAAPWLEYRAGAAPPAATATQGRMERLLSPSHFWETITGGQKRDDALATSAQMAQQRGPWPGMNAPAADRMRWMTSGGNWMNNPMPFSMGTAPMAGSAMGALGAAARPPMAPVAPAQHPTVTEMPGRGVPQGFRGMTEPEPAPAPPSATVDAIMPIEPSSRFATAIASNNPNGVDYGATRAYRAAVRPNTTGAGNAPQLAQQDTRILTAIDQIIKNKQGLTLTDPATGQQITGQLPQTLRQFSEALDSTKRSIFREYDARAETTGDAGIHVDMSPVIEKLRTLAADPVIAALRPSVATEAMGMATRIEQMGAVKPSVAQGMIENINETIKGTFRNQTEQTYSHNTLMKQAAQVIREQLDAAIEEGSGPGYQDLRNRYGSLASIEKDVANAVQRDAIKTGKLPQQFADLWSGSEILHGLFSVSPEHIAKGAALQAVRQMMAHINSPNRAIQKLFVGRQNMINPPPMVDYRNLMPTLPMARPAEDRDLRPSTAGP